MFSSSSRPGLGLAARACIVCLVVILAAACGSGSSATDSGDNTDVESSDTETADAESSDTETADAASAVETTEGDAQTAGGGTDDDAYLEADSPLGAYLGFDISNPDALVEQQRAIDREVQQCMSAQGFEYELTQMPSVAFSVFEDQADMSAAEFAAAHGYGLVDFNRDFVAQLESTADADPNQALIEAMSDSERDAWGIALYGSTLDETDTEAMPEGCLGDAMGEVFGKLAAFMELLPQLDEMEEAAAADPRMVEINEKWTMCMSEAGYDFEDSDDASTSVSEQIDTILDDALDGPANPAGDEQARLDELNAQLDEIRVEEIEIATADATCQGDDAETLKDIQREYELKFLEENKAALDAASS